jgi:hypothetical protein
MSTGPLTKPAEGLAAQFERLAQAWREAAPIHCHNPVRYDHPAYQGIIALGPDVVPLLLRDLAKHHHDWFWALHLVTGADPIPPQERGDWSAMTQTWLDWGRAHGYLPPEDGAAQGPAPAPPAPACASAASSPPTLEETFERLAAIWRAETSYLSSTTAMVNHPAYQEIIKLGPAVVPVILRSLEQRRDWWFWALSALTGASPEEPEDSGRLPRLTASWLRWGRANGYRW